MAKAPARTTKQQSGFQPGKSGNPAGRKAGSRNKVTLAMEALLEGEAEALTRVAIDKALGGDTMALRLCFDRLYPPQRTRSIRIDLPIIKHVDDVVRGYESVLGAVSDGTITPDEASTIASVLEAKRKAIETVEIEARLVELERKS
ncbi:MAG: hypothetical protein HOC63_14525 [Rhodospirillales bacterium]|jgi:hypothetical protein|nr:hypothetical protein [Rhodospirillales bacterium]MBT4627892.1 hypothetical protein [Rhodospirillales bacterium]MBT5521613.1 hypothetical protein [Rhodospirillales bacterium]MBT6110621.1 hypothetical protein [Rhodospirillales bacterium]